MTKYIKAREIENLKCYLDENLKAAEGLGENDIYYRGKIDAMAGISIILDGILDDAADIVQDIKDIKDRYDEEYFDNEAELKESHGILGYLVGKQSIIKRITAELSEVIGAYE